MSMQLLRQSTTPLMRGVIPGEVIQCCNCGNHWFCECCFAQYGAGDWTDLRL